MEQLICSKCGQPLVSGICARCENRTVLRVFRREVVLLVMLCAVTVPLFLFTRSMAARNRAMNVEMASAWYRQGQAQLKEDNVDGAIQSFRNAATNDHDNSEYTLVLASALAAGNHLEDARQVLMRLRNSAPESGEINLNLARLSAKEGKLSEAIRYYHNALYGTWPPDQLLIRTNVRTELVRLLLTTGDTSRALSELLILSSDVPDTEQAHNQVGQMFLQAGDLQHALEQFNRVLRLNGKNVEALQGAGQASFNLGNYDDARRFLDAAVSNGDKSEETADLLETTGLVLSRDPLAPGLSTAERIRRLTVDLNSAGEELEPCLAKTQDDQGAQTVLLPLASELDEGMKTIYRSRDLRSDAEGFRTGLSLVYRIGAATQQICHESSALHRAMLLIGKKHGVAEQ
jgi:tetratricopeptide (TPR) repeat protein